MAINQGDIFWIELEEPIGSEPGYRHPHVVVQNNLFNASRIKTMVVCPLTTNLKRAQAPGNVLLEQGEGGLVKPSVVNVTQMFTIDRTQIGDYIGSLNKKRMLQIVKGIMLVIEPRDAE